MPPETYALTVNAPPIQGIDPTKVKQAVQLALKAAAAFAAKDYGNFALLVLQLFALFAPEPDQPPAPFGASPDVE